MAAECWEAVMERYILDADGKSPVAEPDLMAWARWFQKSAARVLAQDIIRGVKISTVFLGLNHAFYEGPPLLWETMIFGGPHDGYCDRYSTYENAAAGHQRAIALAHAEEGT